MWWKTISRRSPRAATPRGTALDEAFLRRLERLSLSAQRTLRGGLSGEHQSMRRLPAPTFSDHRSYSPSDDLRYVDWNAYARQEQLHVKLGETEQDVPIHILMDRSRSMDYGVGDLNKLHYGRMLLSALGYLALSSGDRLTASGFDSGTTPVWGPQHTKRTGMDLLRYAAGLQPGGASRLGPTLQQYTRPRSGGMVVIISDFWAAGDLDQVLRMLQPPRWQPLLLQVLHPDELEPPVRGDLELEDSEHGDVVMLSADEGTLGRYRQRLAQWCSAIETATVRRGGSYLLLTTDQPLERAAIPFLRQRDVLRG